MPPSKPSPATRNLRSSCRGAVSVVVRTPAPVYRSDIASLPSYHSSVHSAAPPIYPGANDDLGARPSSTFPPSTNRRPASMTSPTSQSTPLACRSHEVKEFLCSCNPNMVSHLNSFLASGCHNRNFLAAVASWSDGDIEGFLRRVVFKKPQGTQVSASEDESGIATLVTNTESFILTRHLKAYFAVGSRSA